MAFLRVFDDRLGNPIPFWDAEGRSWPEHPVDAMGHDWRPDDVMLTKLGPVRIVSVSGQERGLVIVGRLDPAAVGWSATVPGRIDTITIEVHE